MISHYFLGALKFYRNLHTVSFGALKGRSRSRNVLDAAEPDDERRKISYCDILEQTIEEFRSENPPDLSFLNVREPENFDFVDLRRAIRRPPRSINFNDIAQSITWACSKISESMMYKIGFQDAFAKQCIAMFKKHAAGAADEKSIAAEIRNLMLRHSSRKLYVPDKGE